MRQNQSVTFKSVTETADDGGSLVESTTTVLSSYPCIIDDVSSTERIIAERNGHQVSHRLYCNYSSSITKDMIVTWDSEDYRITYLRNPNNLDRTLELDIYRNG